MTFYIAQFEEQVLTEIDINYMLTGCCMHAAVKQEYFLFDIAVHGGKANAAKKTGYAPLLSTKTGLLSLYPEISDTACFSQWENSSVLH